MKNRTILSEVRDASYKQLCKSSILTKRYSKLRLRIMLNRGIKKILIKDIEAGFASGSYCCADRTLTFYYNKDKEPLTIEYIVENAEIFETMIHEAIHALLRNLRGTGLDRIMISKEIPGGTKNNEIFEIIGVGFNEGYTNWILETTGLESDSYDLLTEINRQIAMCIGSDAMMKLASCSHSKFFKRLNMSKVEGIQFLRQMDEIYYIEESIAEMFSMQDYLSEVIQYLSNPESKDDEYFKEIKQQEEMIEETAIYKQLFSEEILEQLYALYDQEAKGSNVTQEKLDVYKQLLETLDTEYIANEEKRIGILAEMVETKILQQLVEQKMDNPKTPEEFHRLWQILQSGKNVLNIYDSKCNAFKELRKKANSKLSQFVGQIYRNTQRIFQNGSITGQGLKRQCNNIAKLIGEEQFKSNHKIREAFINFIAQKSEHVAENRAMIRYIIKYDLYDKSSDLYTKRTKSGKYIIFCNGEVDGIIDENGISSRRYDEDEIEYVEDTDFEKLMIATNAFYEDKTKQGSEYADLYEIGKTFILEENGHHEFYDINDGKNPTVTRAEFTTSEPIRSMFEEERNIGNNEEHQQASKDIKRGQLIDNIRVVLNRKKNVEDSRQVISVTSTEIDR